MQDVDGKKPYDIPEYLAKIDQGNKSDTVFSKRVKSKKNIMWLRWHIKLKTIYQITEKDELTITQQNQTGMERLTTNFLIKKYVESTTPQWLNTYFTRCCFNIICIEIPLDRCDFIFS